MPLLQERSPKSKNTTTYAISVLVLALSVVLFVGQTKLRYQLSSPMSFARSPAEAPADLLQENPVQHIRGWVALTEGERTEYQKREKSVCGKPLQHCCIGQGRQLASRHKNVSQLFIRWGQPLANLTTLLDYMSDRKIPCNLWFFGYSLTGDHAIAALCELMRDAGYQLDHGGCISYKNPRWNEKDALNCSIESEAGMPTEQYYQLTNPHRTSCPKVTIAHSGINHIARNSSYLYSQLGGVILANHGVHCNKPGCVASKMEELLTEQVLDGITESGWHVLWRETERQHFATPNGYYIKGGNYSKIECHTLGTSQRTGTSNRDYRNQEAKVFLRRLAAATNKTIPIVPLADASGPLHFMHGYDGERKAWDCTHYAYSPWRFEITWDGMLQGLKSLEQF